MAASESSKSELWIITSEERAKHDALFLQQNPVGGYLSAEQAKAFFLQSGLPKQKLGQIWALADLDADGRMNHKEFSIAMHLIKKSLHGTDLPSILPPMIKMDPPPLIPAAPFPGMGVYPPFPMGAATLPRIGGPMLPLSNSGPSHIAPSGMLPTGVGPVASIGSPLNSVTLGSIGNTMPPVIQPVLTGSTLSAISKPATSLSNLPIALPTTTTSGFSYPSGSPLPLISGGMSLGLGASPASSPVTTSGSEWSIPQNSRLKYNQMFATADSSQKSFLTGVEAKAILSQYGLNQSTLAKIWSLSDIDGNGNLSRDEFCLAMHLVEMVKNGQTLPTILPSNMIPPSLRAVASRSVTSVRSSSPAIGNSIAGSTNFISPVQVAAPATTTPVKSETFSDLLSINVGRSPITAQTEAVVLPESPKYAVTFEDKRRENFEKGQAELERRRAMLEEQQKKEAEERIAFQKREEEKRERARLEQEKRRQMEMEKQLAKQRQLEQEQEEQRRKQMEQKEAARRELERQRQMEWVQQRRDQLMSEKIRHQSAVDKLRTEDTQLRLELTSMMDKSAELSEKIRQAKQDIITYTSAIEGMKARRDKTLTDIDRFQLGIDESTRKLRIAEQERIALDQQMKGTVLHHDDKLESLRNSCTTRRSTVRQLKSDLSQIEQKSQTTGHQIENYTKQLQSLKKEAMELQQDISRLEKQKSSLKARSATKTAAKKTVDDVAHQEQRVNGVSSAPASTKMERSSSIGSNQQDSVINSGVGAMSAKAENVRPGLLKYTALYDFDAQEDGELSFSVNDIISVYADSVGTQLGWLKGRDESGKTGWLPETYVAPVESVTQPTVHSVLPSEGRRESARDDGLSLPDHVTAAAVPVAANPSTSSKPVEHANSVKRLAEQLQTKLVSRVPSTENARSSPAIPDHGSRVRKDQRAIDGHSSAPVGATDTGADGSRRVKIDLRDDSTWSTSVTGVIAKSTDDSVVQDAASTVDEEQFPEGRIEIYGNISEFSKPTTDTSLNNEIHVSAVNCRKGDLCEALYDYNSEEPSDLVFVAGDVITVELADGEWWTGTIGSRTGMFPANYVRLLTPEQSRNHKAAESKKPEIATVIAAYKATGAEQLSLEPGQLIHVLKKSSSGWWEGELQAKGQRKRVGWFPENYVKLLGQSSDSSNVTPAQTPQQDTANGYQQMQYVDQVVAKYTYDAQQEDELSFVKGAVINVLNKDDPHWWQGEVNASVGLFPSNYITSLTETNEEPYGTIVQQQPPAVATVSMTPELEQKRQQHIDELINTEETFNKDVQTVLEVFYQPFKTDEILTEEELNTMFINWKELQNCSMKLLKALRVRAKMSGEGRPIQNVGDILCEHLPHMTPYIRFCSSQLNSAALLQKKSESDNKFKEAHRKCMQNPRTMNMPLSSFLLKPMQRITKYPLLIEKILQHTPERHPDYLNVQEALQRATELCNQVNEGVREKENSDILEWIQNHVHCDGLTERLTFNSVTNCLGPRKYLHCGVLVKVKSGKDLVGMLFNDFLLLTQPQKAVGQAASFRIDTKSNAQFKMYRNPIVLNEVMVKKPADADDPDGLLFQLSHVDRHYLLRAPTTLERDVWIKKIEAASKEYLETERKKREKAHYMKKSSTVGRLLVVIVEGTNLITGVNGKSDPYCEVSMGAQEHKTKVIPSCLNPKWNASMQFTIKNIQEDVLCITVYDRDLFSPNDFLGRTEIRVKDILEDTRQMKGPVTKRFLLHEVDTGEVVVKLNIQLFDIN